MTIIESFKSSELANLNSIETGHCVSIFIPTSKSGRETLQGPIHLKNLLNEVDQELQSRSLESRTIPSILDPVRALIDNAGFWQNQNHGLAIYAAGGVVRAFGLPFTVPVRQFVGDSFDLVPILPMLSNDGQFYILALSENHVRLLRATRYEFETVRPDGMPTSMNDALPSGDYEKQQQRHGGANGPSTYFGSGNGGDSEDHKGDLKRYFDRVDAAITPSFNKNPAPVVLAGVEYLLPIYRTANSVATILESEIHGNKDRTTDEDLHKEAWEVVASHFTIAQSKAKDNFHQLLGSGVASEDLSEIGTAADTGRVATLFVPINTDSSPSINRIVVATLSKGGDVFATEPEAMPTDKPLAATFRF